MRHILIACFLLLSACGVAPAPTATPQPSPTTAPTVTPIPPTATAIPPTATPIPPTATPAPTATPRPTATTRPTVGPLPTPLKPTPIVFSGKGDDVVSLNLDAKEGWTGEAAMRITATGDGNFVVRNFGKDGVAKGLLVNAIGAYRGVVLLDTYGEAPTERLEVKSSGTWRFEVISEFDIPKRVAPFIYESQGDDVLMSIGGDIAKFEAPNNKGNFVVLEDSVSLTGPDLFQRKLLVNKIGAYTGSAILGFQLSTLIVKAGGPWKVTVTARR